MAPLAQQKKGLWLFLDSSAELVFRSPFGGASARGGARVARGALPNCPYTYTHTDNGCQLVEFIVCGRSQGSLKEDEKEKGKKKEEEKDVSCGLQWQCRTKRVSLYAALAGSAAQSV